MTKKLLLSARPSKPCVEFSTVSPTFLKPKRRRYHSLPAISKADIAKTLERDLLKHEHELIALLGASALAEEQLESVKNTHVCPLCERHFAAQDSGHLRATVLMEEMYHRYLRTITESKLLNKRRAFLLLMKEFKHKMQLDIVVKRTREKFEAEFARGRTTALQEQKRASMELKKCLCCGSSLLSIGDFLKHVDYMLGTEGHRAGVFA